MKLLRFTDLKERGIVSNWPTLRLWIKNEGFPPGVKLAANTIAWEEEEVAEWLATRPEWQEE